MYSLLGSMGYNYITSSLSQVVFFPFQSIIIAVQLNFVCTPFFKALLGYNLRHKIYLIYAIKFTQHKCTTNFSKFVV